jgi:hypothetical protein
MDGGDRVIILVSSSGDRVEVSYSLLKESPALRDMVDNRSFIEHSTSTIHLPVSTPSVKRVLEYLRYKKEYVDKKGEVADFAITDEETLDLLEVASFLRI